MTLLLKPVRPVHRETVNPLPACQSPKIRSSIRKTAMPKRSMSKAAKRPAKTVSDGKGILPELTGKVIDPSAHDGAAQKEGEEGPTVPPAIAREATAESGDEPPVDERFAALPPWQQRFLQGAADGGIAEGCKRAKCSRTTAFRARKASEGFAALWDAALECRVDMIERVGEDVALAGDPRLVEFFLRTRRRAVYGDKLDVSVTGAMALAPLTPEQIAAIVRKLNPELLGGPQP